MNYYKYEYKVINKHNAFLRDKILKWTLNYLKSKFVSSGIDAGLDILLNHLSPEDLELICEALGEANEFLSGEHEFIEELNSFEDRKYNYLIKTIEKFWYKDFIQEMKSYLFDRIGESIKLNEQLIKNDPIVPKFNMLQNTFKLSDDEITALSFCYIISIDSNFEDLFNEGYRRNNDFSRRMKKFSLLTEMSQSDTNRIFYKNNNLHKYELVNNRFEIGNHVCDFLIGISDTPLLSILYKKYNDKPLPLKAHSIRKNDNEILKNIIKNKEKNKGINILLYGVPGTGKTEYVRSFSTKMKYGLYEILCGNNQKNINGNSFSRYSSFYACQNTIPSNKSIILIDEADEMLNGTSFGGFLSLFGGAPSRNTEKNKINELLDSSTSINFWITNHFDNIDASTRRRFDYSIEFREFDYEQRMNVWRTSVKNHNLSSEFKKVDIAFLAGKYKINAGGIDIVLRNFKRMPPKNRNGKTLRSLINSHLKLMGIKNDLKQINCVENYSLKGLNIKGEHSIEEGLEILNTFSNYMNCPEFKECEIRNMNLLLYGPSGTGKTEFVKYMAKKTGRKLIVKQGSDFLGMYVGQTEHNIKQAFKKAELENAILFIDEADGLFFDRGKSMRSFEMTKVNELLIQMENFTGIFVCSTNFHKNMDSATFRRFNLKFEFDYLTPEGIDIFYKMYLKNFPGKPLGKNDKKSLIEINGLTPGDFKVVKQKYIFLDDKKFTHELLIKALKEEVQYKNITQKNEIGF